MFFLHKTYKTNTVGQVHMLEKSKVLPVMMNSLYCIYVTFK